MPIRRKGQRWEVRISAGAGRRVEQRLPPGATRVDAQALEAALRRRLIAAATGRLDYTVSEAITRWRIDAQRLRSWEKDLRYRADVVESAVGHYRLDRIVEAADLIKQRGAEAGLKPASVNRYLALLKRLASLAWRWRWTEAPLAARIELLPGELRRTAYATPQQLKALLLAADSRLRPALKLAALTGLRRGELLAAQRDWIDSGALVVPASVSKTGRTRIVPLTAEAAKLAARLPIGISAPTLRRLFEAARKKAGLPALRWHDLRRSFGTWLVQGGATLADARDLLGHGDVKTTSIYLATARQDLRAAVGNLPRLGERTGKRRAKSGGVAARKRAASA
jgi:integrase